MGKMYEMSGSDAHTMAISLMELAEVVGKIPPDAEMALKPNLGSDKAIPATQNFIFRLLNLHHPSFPVSPETFPPYKMETMYWSREGLFPVTGPYREVSGLCRHAW